MMKSIDVRPAVSREKPSAPLPRRENPERRRVAETLQEWLDATLPRQCRDGSASDGAFAENDTGWYVGRHTAYILPSLIAARLWRQEIEVDLARLDETICWAIAFLRRRQLTDGRIDLDGIYSSNEVGFTLSGLASAYVRVAGFPEFKDALVELREYLVRGADAVLKGSAHTANHRWTAVCAPLASVNRLWPDPRYLAKIEDYLSDGIDCDADGCWHVERSPNYNNVANQGLIIMAETLGNPVFYEPVIRNLNFVLHMVQPNGELDSSFSHRQDRAVRNCLPASYGVARRMAQFTGDGRFSTLAEMVWKNPAARQPEFVPLAFQLDDHPGPLPEPVPLPTVYEKTFAGAGLVRRRENATALTVSADSADHFFSVVRDQWGGPRHSDDWFHLHHGDVVIQSLHLAGAGMANIQPADLRRAGPGHYYLDGIHRGWLHTLHFRPQSPVVEVEWDWKYEIAIRWRQQTMDISLKSDTPHSLGAVLRFWLRAPVQIEERLDGNGHHGPRRLAAGEELWLHGGGDVAIQGETNSLRVTGLPPSQHRQSIRHPQPIPSQMERHCGCLSIGLTFPVDLNFKIILE